MFRPVELVRVDIYVLKTYVSRVTWALARMRLVHLVDVHASMAEGRVPIDSEKAQQAERRSAAIVERARRLMDLIGLAYEPLAVRVDAVSEEKLETSDEQLATLEHTISTLTERARQLAQSTVPASLTARIFKLLAEAETDPAALARSGRLMVWIGILPVEQVALVEQKMGPLPHFFKEYGEVDNGRAVLAAFLPADLAKVQEIFREVKFQAIPNPDEPIAIAAGSAAKTESELSSAFRSARETLRRATLQAGAPLAMIRRQAEIALGLARAQRGFGTVGHTMIISGWVPKDRLDEIRRVVEEHAPGAAYVEVVDPSVLRRVSPGFTLVPVLFNNPLLLKPFERITAAYGTPQYGEVEPTAFLAVSFLIMFGVMFGDVGQGVFLALMGYLIFRISFRYTDAGVLLIECGTVSAIFGVLYGSVFGAENLIPALWFNPMRNVSTSIGVSLAFGAVLISIGLLLNVVNSFRRRETSAALLGEHGLVGAFMYWVCLAIGTKFLLTGKVGLTGSALTLLVGLPALIILFHRPIEEIFRRRRAKQPAWREMPFILVESLVDLGDAFLSYLANTVSFIRISAFALAHVGLFAAVFALADTLSHLSGGGIWYWSTLVLGNVVIIALEGMMASIQAIRLEYYELFSKFFKGGGELFRPLEV